jgi:hypothetical protein
MSTTTLDRLCTYLDVALDGDADVWRNSLPAGYDNTEAACVVSLQSEAHHQSRADRDVRFEVRVYGGSAQSTEAALLGEEVIELLNNAYSNALYIQRIGEIVGQELPPEPATGWPSYRITGRMLMTNQTLGGS